MKNKRGGFSVDTPLDDIIAGNVPQRVVAKLVCPCGLPVVLTPDENSHPSYMCSNKHVSTLALLHRVEPPPIKKNKGK